MNGILASVQDIKSAREGVTMSGTVLTLDVLAPELYRLSSSFQEIKYIWWWCMVPKREKLKEGRCSRMTWTLESVDSAV